MTAQAFSMNQLFSPSLYTQYDKVILSLLHPFLSLLGAHNSFSLYEAAEAEAVTLVVESVVF